MSLSIMGSVNTYTKTMKLQTQWNLKQQSGDYTSHKKSLDEWISTAQETLKKSRRGLYGNQDDDEEGNKKLNNIMQKIYAGKKLTQKERQYLQAKNPQAYEKLRASEQEQKAFEKKLRLCRTKEEVQRLKMTQLASSMAIVGSVQNNSKIPLEKKLEICMQEKMRCDRIEASTRAFVNSGEYNRLPTEAEQAKAHKEEKEKQQVHKKPKPEQKPSKPQQPDVDLELNPDTTEKPAIKPETSTEQSTDYQPTIGQTSQQVGVKPAAATGTANRSEFTDSPELRKVRRARRQTGRAAYAAAPDPAPNPPALNIKA